MEKNYSFVDASGVYHVAHSVQELRHEMQLAREN